MAEPTYRDLVAHYESCLDRHGDTPRGVDWPDAAGADVRYAVMLGVVRERPATLLDFGCGASHLYEFLLRHEIPGIVYSGLDLSEKFLSLSRSKFPEVAYYNVDILEEPDCVPTFDYIVLNGVLTEKRGLSHAAMFDYARRLLRAVFAKARKGLAFNVLSTQVDWQRDDLFHLSLDDMADFVTRDLSRHFAVRRDYGLYEYTTYVSREPTSWHG